MQDKFLMLLPLILPLLGAGFAWLWKEKVRNFFSIILPLISFSLLLYFWFNKTLPYTSSFFMVDYFTLIFSAVFTLLGAVSLFYASSYLSGEKHTNEFHSFTLLLIAGLVGASYSRNLLLLYIFWELVAVSTWRLIGFYRKKRIVRIADKTLLMTFLGSSFMLLGILWVYKSTGTLDLIRLRDIGSSVAYPSLILILLGVIAKSATFPMHTWLPDAHPVAPSPMSAVLSGIVAKLGLVVFVRLFYLTHTSFWESFFILALLSSLAAGAGAFLVNDMKRVIAYSTVSQLGFIFMGFALFTKIGWSAAIFYFVAHAIAKGGLFLGAGVVERATGTRDLDKLGGLRKGMPVTAFSMSLCAVSIMGFPPLAGFFPKLMIIKGIVDSGHPGLAMGAILSSMLTLLYLSRLMIKVFGGEVTSDNSKVKEGKAVMVGSVFFLGLLSLAIGLIAPYFLEYSYPFFAFLGGK